MTPADQVNYSRRRSGWALFLLGAIYASNYADRSILNVLAQPIKVDLDLSDSQIGLLSGLAFATFYALFGLPLARVSERAGRLNVISACALLWSAMTMLCGAAGSFFQLVTFRFGVGIGESGLAAPAHSLISDYYPPARRTSAIALFSIGVPIGALIGSIAGGLLAQHYGWRVAFLAAGLPGFVLAPLLRFTVKEPVRGNWDAVSGMKSSAAVAPPLRAVLARQFSTATFRHFCAGTVITTLAGSGASFVGAYYVRRFHIDYAAAGLILGVVIGGGALIGTFLGGFVSDWLARWSRRWYALLPSVSILLAAPLYMTGYLQDLWQIQVPIMLVSQILVSMTTVPFYGVTQNLMPARMRASAAAISFLLINLIGNGFGPVIYGYVIDRLTSYFFAANGLGNYIEICGRGGGHSATGGIASACQAALAQGTRWGLAGGALGLAWAGVHYFIASRNLCADFDRNEANDRAPETA